MTHALPASSSGGEGAADSKAKGPGRPPKRGGGSLQELGRPSAMGRGSVEGPRRSQTMPPPSMRGPF
jgi:hypothetical protein